MRFLLIITLLIGLTSPPWLLASNCCDETNAETPQAQSASSADEQSMPCHQHVDKSEVDPEFEFQHNCQCLIGSAGACLNIQPDSQSIDGAAPNLDVGNTSPLQHIQPLIRPPIYS